MCRHGARGPKNRKFADVLYGWSQMKRQTCVEEVIVVIMKFRRKTSIAVKSITPISKFLGYDRIPNLMPWKSQRWFHFSLIHHFRLHQHCGHLLRISYVQCCLVSHLIWNQIEQSSSQAVIEQLSGSFRRIPQLCREYTDPWGVEW